MMKALLAKKDTTSSVPSLIFTTLSIPSTKPGYILVRVRAAAINPSDVMNAKGGFSHTTFPRIPGRDFAGVVAAGPPSLIDKNVFGTSGNLLSYTEDGTHAEFCLVPEEAVAPMPTNLTFAQAATIGVPWTTACIVLQRASVSSGETVLVIGATGAVGRAVVQLAELKGCKVITASRRDITDINTIRDPQFSKVLQLTNDHGADVVIDTVGDPVLMRAALGILAVRGRLSFIAARPNNTEMTFDIKQLYRKEHSIVGCNSVNYTEEEMGTLLRNIAPEFETGKLHVVPDDKLVKVTLGEEAVDAYKWVPEHSGEKVVIMID